MPAVTDKETVEFVTADRDFIEGIKKGVKACKKGKLRRWDEIKAEMGLR